MNQVPKIQLMVYEWTPETFIRVIFRVRVIYQQFDSFTALPQLFTLPYTPS